MKNKTLQEQIDKFYKETGYQLKIKDGKPYYGGFLNLDAYLNLDGADITNLPENLVVSGSLNLYGSKISKLPKNLVVGDYLNLEKTKITELPENLIVGGCLNLRGTKITKLPKNLIVGGWLDLDGADITNLPENLVVRGNLFLQNTKITELPENLIVGGCLNLYDTKITKLPKNLVVGGWLDLSDTKISELPDNLVVGGGLDLYGTKIVELPENLVVGGGLSLYDTKVSKLPENLIVGGCVYGMSNEPITLALSKDARKKVQQAKNFLQWNVDGKTYIKVDDIFSVVDSHKGNVWRTHRIGKEETLYVVTDGEGHYAHGFTLKEAKKDLLYKINDRDTSSYKNLSLDDELSFDEAIAMYRTITGACSAGTRDFVENRLPEPLKENYTIREIIELTDGEYGSKSLKKFFKVSNR